MTAPPLNAGRQVRGARALLLGTARTTSLGLFVVVLPVVVAVYTYSPFPSYGLSFPLLWGHQLARGELPQFVGARIDTPHPLGEALATVLAALPGDDVQAVTVGVCAVYVLLVMLAAAVAHALGGWVAAAIAAAVLTTRPVVAALSTVSWTGSLFTVALLAAALAVLHGRPRLAIAAAVMSGLERPEGWVVAATLVFVEIGGLRWIREAQRAPLAAVRGQVWVLLLAIAAPTLWAFHDLVLARDPLFSFTYTREYATSLGRMTGVDALMSLPIRLSEMLGHSMALIVAVAVLTAAVRCPRARSILVTIVLPCAVASIALVIVGTSFQPRYFLPVIVLAVAIGAGAVVGLWRTARSGRFRIGLPIVALAAVLIDCVIRAGSIAGFRDNRQREAAAYRDLGSALEALRRIGVCGPIRTDNNRVEPLLALRLDVRQSSVSADVDPERAGAQLWLVDGPQRRAVTEDGLYDEGGPPFIVTATTRSFGDWRLDVKCGA